MLEESSALIPPERFQPLAGSVFDEQGRVPVVVIRPGIGKGRGRHLYEAAMLRENAQKFEGWKMFIDHLSQEARRAAGGLPRSIRDLGGRLTETWWQEDFPADPSKGHGQGAVLGLAKPVPFVRELIEHDPEIVENSISASATAVRPVTRDGQRVWLVEGIEDYGSLDWVTEAGAGGRVLSLMESAYGTQEGIDLALLESVTDGELLHHLQEARPDLLEAMKGKGGGDYDSDEHKAKCKELEKKGMPHEAAKKAARKALSEATDPEGGDDMGEITPEALQEALAASPDIITKALQESAEVQLFVNGLVEAKLEEEREGIEHEAQQRAQRQIDLRDMRDSAHELIRESKLPESWQVGLRERYDLQEGKPTSALDVLDEVDDDGKVTKTARTRLAEAVAEDIKSERTRLAEANPTRVRAPQPAADGVVRVAPNSVASKWLQESGVESDPDKDKALQG